MLRSGWLAFVLSGCSFVLVKGPPDTYQRGTLTCTDEDIVPTIDALAGVLALSGAVGGELVTELTDHTVHRFELYYGLPLVITGIVYLLAASRGTDKVQSCRATKAGESVGCDGCPARVP